MEEKDKDQLKKLFSRPDWDEETIIEADKIVSRIAEEYLGLDTYPNQFEIISSEQMLDAYRSVRDGLQKRIKEALGWRPMMPARRDDKG